MTTEAVEVVLKYTQNKGILSMSGLFINPEKSRILTPSLKYEKIILDSTTVYCAE